MIFNEPASPSILDIRDELEGDGGDDGLQAYGYEMFVVTPTRKVARYIVSLEEAEKSAVTSFSTEHPPLGAIYCMNVQAFTVAPLALKRLTDIMLVSLSILDRLVMRWVRTIELGRVKGEFDWCLRESGKTARYVDAGRNLLRATALENKIKVSGYILDLKLGLRRGW